ncbi:electron carrier [Ascosphaera acerosa]|nr:electron carrier [Ascosphaera acerosa]
MAPIPAAAAAAPSSRRTLLLSPPSLAASPDAMSAATQPFAQGPTDMQMLDRLQAGLASLPPARYDQAVLLPGAAASDDDDAAAALAETLKFLNRDMLLAIARSLLPGGTVRVQQPSPSAAVAVGAGTAAKPPGLNALLDPSLQLEALLAGLLVDPASQNLYLPSYEPAAAVPLKKPASAISKTTRTTTITTPTQPTGVVMVDPTADLDDDDDLIDEDELLDDDDAAVMDGIMQPPECRPKPGRRRRACKDCSCGLAERLQQEDLERRRRADQAASVVSRRVDRRSFPVTAGAMQL